MARTSRSKSKKVETTPEELNTMENTLIAEQVIPSSEEITPAKHKTSKKEDNKKEIAKKQDDKKYKAQSLADFLF